MESVQHRHLQGSADTIRTVGCPRWAILVVIATLLACSGTPPFPIIRSLEPLDDPAVLPYRFTSDYSGAHKDRTDLFPVDFDGDGTMESYQIQRGRDATGDLESILFYSCLSCGAVTSHENFPNATFFQTSSTLAGDFDSDGFQEVAVVYHAEDTIWLGILSPYRDTVYRQFVTAVSDNNGDGKWDGAAYVTAYHDFTGDGVAEILVVIDTGYDFYPRMLACVDWSSERILWTYNSAGLITYAQTRILPGADEGDDLIVFGIASKGNEYSTADMDDLHSYLVCLDATGEERWRRVTGPVFTNPTPLIIDYDDDHEPEILFTVREDTTTSAGLDAFHRGVLSAFVVCEPSGEVLDSIPVASKRRIRGLNSFDDGLNGKRMVFYDMRDDTLRICNERLEPIISCSYPGTPFVKALDRFLDTKDRQFLVSTNDGRLWVLDTLFRPLAQFAKPITARDVRVVPPRTVDEPARILINGLSNGYHTNLILRAIKSPWYAIFSRNPLLAFAVGFGPLSLILVLVTIIMVQRKRKNVVISRQRDELSATLTTLEETKERLIAIEKTQLMNDIAGGVAHEVRNALDPAVRCLHALQDDGDDTGSERTTEMLRLSEKAVQRAVGITRMIRELADLSLHPTSECADLKAVIDDVLGRSREQMTAAGITVRAEIPKSLTVRCPHNHAVALFANLIRNAVDALAGSNERVIRVHSTAADNQVRVHIADSGPGIPEKERERIFSPFYSTKPSTGMGLGLTFARRISELHGGSLVLQDASGGGAEFLVTLLQSTSSTNAGATS